MKTGNRISIGMIVLLLVVCMALIFLFQPGETVVKQHNMAPDMGPTHQSGDYQVQVKLNPEKPKIGNNKLILAIRNVNQMPVTDVIILAYVEMPAMGSMQAMREAISIENIGDGLYQGHYSLPMNGSWPLTIRLESIKQGKAEVVFDMNTSRTGVKLIQATPSKLSPQPNQTPASEQQLVKFSVDNYRRQLIGVTTNDVVYQNIVKTIHAGARISYDQSRLTDISLKYDAWIGDLNADYLGKKIHQGETLFTVYSPDLVSAQDEYLESLNHRYSSGLRKAARKRLARWGLNATQIKTLEQRGRAVDYLPIASPVNGTIIEKNIVAGSAVKAGLSVLRLADLSTVWVEGEVYETDLPWLKVGMEVRITLPERLEQSNTATVTFIDPILNPHTRSAVIRTELANADGTLRPDMYANMNLLVDLGKRLVIPEQAVIYSNDQRIVFVDQGNGQLLPVKIKTGLRNEDMIEVLEGLERGDVIVTSGNFLIAAESKLKAGLAQW